MARPFTSQSMAVAGQVDSMAVEFRPCETNGLGRTRTWTIRLTDGDANHFTIFATLHNDAYDSPPYFLNRRRVVIY